MHNLGEINKAYIIIAATSNLYTTEIILSIIIIMFQTAVLANMG